MKRIRNAANFILILAVLLGSALPAFADCGEDYLYLDDMAELQAAAPANDYRASMMGSYPAERNVSGAGIKIALIDSGLSDDFVNYSSAVILEGTNYLEDADSPDRHNTNDTYGHGTFVASIICGDEIGLAPGVTIIPLKCFDSKRSSYESVISAIYDAVDLYQCDIINLSLGSASENNALKQAVQYALDNGVIITASSGNLTSNSTGDDVKYYPASQDGVISVGAVGKAKKVWGHSRQNDSVFITAPGEAVIGFGMSEGEITLYSSQSGTSFAAPVVTAAAALALSAAPEMTSEEFADLLADTAEDLGEPGRDNTFGYGLVNPGLMISTILKDTESIILSTYNTKTCISAYIEPGAPEDLGFLASYDENGKMLSLEFWSCDTPKIINNYVLPKYTNCCKLLNLKDHTEPGSSPRIKELLPD